MNIWVLATDLFQCLSWVFATQERKKERKVVDGEIQVSPINHFRMQIVREQRDYPTSGGDLSLYGRTGVVVRRGPEIGSHTGRRVRDGHLKTA